MESLRTPQLSPRTERPRDHVPPPHVSLTAATQTSHAAGQGGRDEAEEGYVFERSWRQKFDDAFHGISCGVRGESSFFVHLFATAVVVTTAAALEATLWHWCLLLVCITVVLVAEFFNTALERLARAVNRQSDPQIREALDIASAAVLTASFGAALIGLVIFVHLMGPMLKWW